MLRLPGLVLVSLAVSCSATGRIQLVLPPKGGHGGYTVGIADAFAGTVTEHGSVVFPSTTCSPGWVVGHGTNGQTSTSFHTNFSWFLLGQEMCDTRVNQTMLFDVFGMYTDGTPTSVVAKRVRTWQLAGGKPTEPFHADGTANVGMYGNFDKWSKKLLPFWNIVWDWSCNIIVVAPGETQGEVAYQTLQVSEYDSEVRPQPNLLSYKQGCTDCWVKVNGGAVLQPMPQTTRPRTSELNCGDQCILYVTEEYVGADGGTDVLPRRIVGRTYRTGHVVSNITDTVNVKTWTYGNPMSMAGTAEADAKLAADPTPPMFGLGVCCTDAHCAPACAGHEGSLALVSYMGKDAQIDVLEILPLHSSDEAAMEAAIALGVIIEPTVLWGPPGGDLAARVFINKKVVSYTLKVSGGGYKSRLNSTSATELPETPVAWNFQ